MADPPTTTGPPVSATPGGVAKTAANIRKPTADEQKIIDKNEDERFSALKKAIEIADGLLSRRTKANGGGFQFIEGDTRTILAINRWTYTTQLLDPFWDVLGKARALMLQNQAIGRLGHSVDTVRKYHAYVHQKHKSRGVFFCHEVYWGDHPWCQREVLMHEYYHFCGCGHHYSTTKTDEALQCAHHMAELVFDLALGSTSGCGGNPICRLKPSEID